MRMNPTWNKVAITIGRFLNDGGLKLIEMLSYYVADGIEPDLTDYDSATVNAWIAMKLIIDDEAKREQAEKDRQEAEDERQAKLEAERHAKRVEAGAKGGKAKAINRDASVANDSNATNVIAMPSEAKQNLAMLSNAKQCYNEVENAKDLPTESCEKANKINGLSDYADSADSENRTLYIYNNSSNIELLDSKDNSGNNNLEKEKDSNTKIETEKNRGCGGKGKQKSVSRKRTEYTPEFERFWEAYPRHDSKVKAFESFVNVHADEVIDTVVEAIEKACHSEQWCSNDGKYIPMATTWLNQKRWEASGVDKSKLGIRNPHEHVYEHYAEGVNPFDDWI